MFKMVTSSFIDKKETNQLNNALVFDLETTGLDINSCDIISFHGYSYLENRYYNLLYKNNKEKILDILLSHNLYITYNGDNFDIPVISRIFGKNFLNIKNLDLLKIIRKRGTLIRYGGFKSNTLYNISRSLDLPHKKTEFDFNEIIDLKDTKKVHELLIYGKQDVDVTKDLLEYLLNYFEFYKQYLPEKDIISWSWLMSSPGTYAYKVICYLSGIKERWPTREESDLMQYKKEKFKGGYVSIPSSELEKGNLYCLDFNSAYPHAYIMLNLFGFNCSCCSENEKYTGGKIFNLQGKYCTKKLSPISKTIKELYDLRLLYKKNKDPREVALKIILNILYGIGGNPVFMNVFNINTVSDCTKFVRESVKLARKKFSKYGYDVIYTDTDSVYLRDNYNDEKKLLDNKDKIIKLIKDSSPFPTDTFDMGIDDKIKLMYFPKLKKKNYLYVTQDNKIKFKGLPIMKDNASRLSMFIFEKYIKKEILQGVVKINSSTLRHIIYSELEEDITKAAVTYRAKKYDLYDIKTSIYSQISKKYGAGVHILIPNIKGIGVGKCKSYCTIKEFKDNNLNIKDIDLSKIFNELQIFSETDINNDYTTKSLEKWI